MAEQDLPAATDADAGDSSPQSDHPLDVRRCTLTVWQRFRVVAEVISRHAAAGTLRWLATGEDSSIIFAWFVVDVIHELAVRRPWIKA